MAEKEITALLPEHPRWGLDAAALSGNAGEFGGGFLVYRREAFQEATVPMKDTMDIADWEAYERGIRRFWGAVCTCSECGAEWRTDWRKGGKLDAYEAPDGTRYSTHLPEGEDFADTDEEDGEYPERFPDGGMVRLSEGDTMLCPYCGAEVKLVRRSRLRNGRLYRLMAGSVESVGGYTAVLFWMISRRLSPWGESRTETRPCAAAVVDRDGTLRFFSHAEYGYGGKLIPGGAWKRTRGFDPFQARYYSYEAVCHTKMGGWMWRDVPDQTGKTGEKTGLADYIRDGGNWPVLYLRFWKKYPAVENLVKSGWTRTADDCISSEMDRREYAKTEFPNGLRDMLNWSAVRPCEILGMSRRAAGLGRVWQWDASTLALWRELLIFQCAAPEDAEDFQRYVTEYGFQNMNTYTAFVTDGAEYSMEQIDRYLRKQQRKYNLPLPDGMQMLFDYHTMLHEALNGQAMTGEERWPKNLRSAHDRMAAAREADRTVGFEKILRRWGALEWTDGECRAVLPRTSGDLTEEGRKLHHCVGSYARSHAAGKIIVFIRHYRRPERSWFTLNEDLTGDRPRRIQLHGYGNEYAHGKRLTIPQKVLDFCDRWEQEVLLPVFRDVRRRTRRPEGYGAEKKCENRP